MGKVTKDGRVENWIDPLFFKWCVKNGYKVIPARKAIEVEEKAIRDYIKKYGVDPANPKVENVNGVLLPKEYVEELIKSGKLTPGSGSSNCPATVTPEGARALNGNLYLWIAEAGDPQHKPTQAYFQDTINAYGRFYQFGVDNLYYYKYYNYWCWDASDVSPWDSSDELLDDLRDDTGQVRDDFNDKDPSNDIVIGWVKYADHNGIAYCDGFFSVAATEAAGVDWPHDSIAQHEISHNFNAPDHGYYCQVCIMCYTWAYATDIWCPEVCKPVIDGNINYQG